MPYTIRKQGNRHCVVKSNGNSVPGGCHPTMKEAQAHLGALEANVDDAKSKKDAGSKVKKPVKSYTSKNTSKASAKKGIDYKWKGR
jgi:hypothetical protein